MTGEADEALVVRSRRGDRAAFEELVRRTARLIYAQLYLKSRDVHKTEDLVQETYLVAWRSIGELADPRTFRAWLTTIASSAFLDGLRREMRKKRSAERRAASGGERGEALDRRPSPAESASLEDERSRALRMLESLPQEYREPLMLRYLAGADYQEIGKQLAISNGSLRGLLQRGMKLLRERMQEEP
jgi:RNA polymerase sigma-70 factor, ECF subfamily